MAIARQLYQLQENDTLIEQEEQALTARTGQLGKRLALDVARDRLTAAQEQLKELGHRRREAEGELDDILSKIAAAEQQLYGGKITNPKELSNLQHEVNTLKTHSDQAETKALEIIDKLEDSENGVAAQSSEYQKLEEEWLSQQQQLNDEIAKLNTSLGELKLRRQQLTTLIDASALNLYEKIRQQKKQAVAKVEQGICRACRILLSASALQKARSGQPVQCGTCGRILFIS
jgi:predicted  nucleic acid-binding Zn-ribbon protein